MLKARSSEHEILVIGGVAAGTKATAKLKREDRGAQVKVLTKSADISYAGCGLPYYVGGLIGTREELIVNTPEKYAGLTGAEVVTGCEVTSVDFAAKSVTAVKGGETVTETYDKLILATGAQPIVPDVPGKELPGVFCLRTPDDATGLLAYVKENKCRSAAVVGAGFIGLEAAENLAAQGLTVTVVDAAPQIMPNAFDPEMASFARRRLKDAGVRTMTNCRLTAVRGTERAQGIETDGGAVTADVVVLAIGVRPATAFLADSGLEMVKGAIVANSTMATNVPDVYAAGDCALVRNMQTGKQQWSAMGSTANIAARVLAKHLSGENAVYGGCLGTGVVKLLPQLNAGRTGLTETQARAEGFDAVSVVCVTDDKAHYYPGASAFITKLVADLGVIGQRVPMSDLSKCRGCRVCQIEKACPIHAASMKDVKLVIDTDACNYCGRCVTKCPFGAVEDSIPGYKIYIGGRWGKRVAEGRALSKIFTSEEEVIEMVEKAILLFRDEGISGERFADTIARLGFDVVEDKLLNGKLDKEAVMNKTVVGGATC